MQADRQVIRFYQLQTSSKIKNRIGFDAGAIKIDQVGAWRLTQLVQSFFINFQRHTTLVSSGKRSPEALIFIAEAKTKDVALIVIRNELYAGTDLDKLAGQKESPVNRS